MISELDFTYINNWSTDFFLWMWNNKEWLFSGAGIVVLSKLISKNRSSTNKNTESINNLKLELNEFDIKISNIDVSTNKTSIDSTTNTNFMVTKQLVKHDETNITHIHNGINEEKAKEIALKVFVDNATTLVEDAKLKASERVNDFNNQLLSKISDTLDILGDPGFQSILLKSQINYAKSGDNNQLELLLNLLGSRAKEKGRSLHQIAIDEAINIVDILTTDQINLMSLVFYCREVGFEKNDTLPLLFNNLDEINPLFQSLANSTLQDIEHIQYSNCGDTTASKLVLFDSIVKHNSHLFTHLISENEISLLSLTDQMKSDFFIKNNDGNYRFSKSISELKKEFFNSHNSYQDNIVNEIFELIDNKTLDLEEIISTLLKANPSLIKLQDNLDKTRASLIKLNKVGRVIAYTNLKRFIELE